MNIIVHGVKDVRTLHTGHIRHDTIVVVLKSNDDLVLDLFFD